ncbi:MAG: hypothetical protein RL110_983 [Bacteroidota bacterium]
MRDWCPQQESLENIFKLCLKESLDLFGKRILVVGRNGFISNWIIHYIDFLNRLLGAEVDVSTFSFERLHHVEISQITECKHYLHTVRFTKFEELRNKGKYFDVVLYAATPTTRISKEQYQDLYNKSRSLYTFLSEEIMTSLIIHLSSGVVYDSSKIGFRPFKETDQTNPIPIEYDYLYSKLMLEEDTRNLAKKMNAKFVNLRLFAFLGPGLNLDSEFAAANFINDALKGRPIKVRNPGTIRSYMHPADLVSYIVKIMADPIPDIVNIGSDEIIDMKNLATCIAMEFDSNIEILDSNLIANYYVPDLNRLHSNYGNNKMFDLKGAIRDWVVQISQNSMREPMEEDSV